MKKIIVFIIILNIFINGTLADQQQVIDKVAAVVENSVILESEINNMISTVIHIAQKDNKQLPDYATLRLKIINQLIMNNIMLHLAHRSNITISKEQLNHAISNIATKNNMTVDQLRYRLAYDGIGFDTYCEQIRKEMMISELRNSEVRRRITILPQEVESITQQIWIGNDTEYNISHIIILLPKHNKTEDKIKKLEKLAISLAEKSKRGADFSKLAIIYSDDYALNGGQLGWKRIKDLPSIFAKCMNGVKNGSIVGPIRSEIGFHILKINKIREKKHKFMVTEFHTRHILLRTSVLINDQQAKDKLKDIAFKIKEKRISFNAAAKQLSEDLYSANNGGDIGWISEYDFDPELRNALIYLKKGEISMPVHSSLGWHLIQIIDTRQVDRSNVVIKDRAYQLLFNRKFAEETQNWMQEKRVSTYVKLIDINQ